MRKISQKCTYHLLKKTFLISSTECTYFAPCLKIWKKTSFFSLQNKRSPSELQILKSKDTLSLHRLRDLRMISRRVETDYLIRICVLLIFNFSLHFFLSWFLESSWSATTDANIVTDCQQKTVKQFKLITTRWRSKRFWVMRYNNPLVC